jgi:hypothetical protein
MDMARLGDQIADLEGRLERKVVAFARAHDVSANRLAKMAGLDESLVRGLLKPGWKRSLKTLCRLEAAIPSDWRWTDGQDDPGDVPMSAVDLPQRVLDRQKRSRIHKVVDAWRESAGILTESLRAALSDGDVQAYTTALSCKDKDFCFTNQGVGVDVFGDDFRPQGKRLLDIPDKRYARWVHDRVFRAYSLEEPLLQNIHSFVQRPEGGRLLRHWALLLPVFGSQGAPPDLMLSVCLPEWERRGDSSRPSL